MDGVFMLFFKDVFRKTDDCQIIRIGGTRNVKIEYIKFSFVI